MVGNKRAFAAPIFAPIAESLYSAARTSGRLCSKSLGKPEAKAVLLVIFVTRCDGNKLLGTC